MLFSHLTFKWDEEVHMQTQTKEESVKYQLIDLVILLLL